MVGFSLGTPEGDRWYFPVRHTIEPQDNMDPEATFRWASDQLGDPNRHIVGANLMYDLGGLRHEGVKVRGHLIDVQFAEALLSERAKVSLEILGHKYLGRGKTSGQLAQWCADFYGGKPEIEDQKGNIHRAPPRLVGPYGEGDADLPLQLAPVLYEHLEREGLLGVFRMECDLIRLWVDMRYAGVSVDIPKAEEMSAWLDKRVTYEQKLLNTEVGEEVNVYASESLARAFDGLGLKYPRTDPTKGHPTGQPSFIKGFLENLEHPVASRIREIKRLGKLNGTFLKGYILGGHVNGKIHGSIHPLRGDEGGTIIGRLAYRKPNLQNVPIRDEELGKPLRSIFTPDSGHVSWKKIDASQIQYRGLVHYAVGPGSEVARQRYRDNPNTDYHRWVQGLLETLFSVKLPRRPVKNINFGLSFGMGIAKLIADLVLYARIEIKTHPEMADSLKFLSTVVGARAFLEKYHQGVPFAKPTIKYFMDLAERDGYLVSLLGRRSRFDLWEPAAWGETEVPALPYNQALLTYGRIRRAYLHKALNRMLQMFEADAMKAMMWRCMADGVFDYTGVPRLQVHDELDFSDPGGRDDGFEEIKRIGETVVADRVSIPLLWDWDTGENWGAVG